MSIYDEILKQAQSEIGLQDIVQDLKRPLHLLQELQEQLNNLPTSEQASIANIQIKKKAHHILHNHLPSMLEQYCRGSLEYTHNMKQNSDSKKLLLKNIAKITEETLVLQEDFHESNKFKFLVHEKIASGLGFSYDVLGHNKPSLALKNQFNYQEYIATHDDIFKKPVITEQHTLAAQHIVDDAIQSVSHNIIAVLTLAVLAMAGYQLSSAIIDKHRLDYSYNEITQLKNNLEVLGASSTNYGFVENTELIKSSLPYHSTKNIFDGEIKIEPYTQHHTNDSYMITYLNVPQKTCRILKNSLKKDFKEVKVNDGKHTCGESNSLSFIETK